MGNIEKVRRNLSDLIKNISSTFFELIYNSTDVSKFGSYKAIKIDYDRYEEIAILNHVEYELFKKNT